MAKIVSFFFNFQIFFFKNSLQYFSKNSKHFCLIASANVERFFFLATPSCVLIFEVFAKSFLSKGYILKFFMFSFLLDAKSAVLARFAAPIAAEILLVFLKNQKIVADSGMLLIRK